MYAAILKLYDMVFTLLVNLHGSGSVTSYHRSFNPLRSKISDILVGYVNNHGDKNKYNKMRVHGVL